jgi:transcriptional repressor NrdR
MICPFCLHKKTQVYNSRQTAKINATWRRRRCDTCSRTFTTRESADPESILRVGTVKRTAPYSRAKLTLSILSVCDHRADHGEAAYWLNNSIEQKLYRLATGENNAITKKQVVNTVLETLKNFDMAAYLKYLTRYSPELDARTLKRYLK